MDPLTAGYLIVLIVGLGTLLIWSRVRAALAARDLTVDDLQMALDGLRANYDLCMDDLGAAALQRDDAVEQLEILRQTHEDLRLDRGELVLDLQAAKQVIAKTTNQRDTAWAAKDRTFNEMLDVRGSLAAQLDKVREAEDQLRGLQEELHEAIAERDGALLNLAGANARLTSAIDVLCGDVEIPLT